MKTKIFTLIVFWGISIFSFTNAMQPTTFLKDENINGKVKSITETYIGVKYKNEQRKNVYLFNAKGQMTKDTYYWQDKPSSSVTDYTYDAKGFFISEKTTDPTKGTTERKETYLNDLKGNPIKENTYYDGSSKPSYVKTFTRNPAGKVLTEITKTLPENKIYYPKLTYKYDTKGNKIEQYIEYGYGDYSKSKYHLTYNKKGKIEKEIEDSEFTSMVTGELEYRKTIKIYMYDEKDRILTVTNNSGDIYEQYVYDDKGNITKDKEAEYIYEYDEKDNWIKKTTAKGGEIYCIEERIYVYV